MIGINEVISKFEDNMSTVSQKLHDEREMLRQCRERNKLHAKTTRDRKKSQMGSLENRIGNLVDEVISNFGTNMILYMIEVHRDLKIRLLLLTKLYFDFSLMNHRKTVSRALSQSHLLQVF